MEYKFRVIKIVPVNTIKAWPEFFYFSWFLSLLCIFMTQIDLKNEGISHANLVTHFNFRMKHMKIVLDSHYYFCITHYFSADLAYFSKSFLQMCKCTRCLKITEKVAFNIASEASYVYILSRWKLIKNAKNWSILTSFWKHETLKNVSF